AGAGGLDHPAPARLVAAEHLEGIGALVAHGAGDDLVHGLLGEEGVERLTSDDRIDPNGGFHSCSLRPLSSNRVGTNLPGLAFGARSGASPLSHADGFTPAARSEEHTSELQSR